MATIVAKLVDYWLWLALATLVVAGLLYAHRRGLLERWMARLRR